MDQKDTKPHKTFDFTVFWSNDAEYESAVQTLRAWTADATRLQASYELGDKTEREHLQCKITWRVAKRWSAMKKLIGNTHFEVSKSKCFAYCAKLDANLIIMHDSRAPGARKDLADMKKMIDDGANDIDLWNEHFGSMCRYNSAMAKYKTLINKKKPRPRLEVEWIVGPSGIGKSSRADIENPDAYWLNIDGTGNIWWDGYDDEEVVVIDDFRGSMFKYNDLLKLLNSRGKYRIAFKGGSAWLSCKKIVITSVEGPEDCYPHHYDEQLKRRITKRIDLSEVPVTA